MYHSLFFLSPFKIGWYNNAVTDKKFAFSDTDPNTLAFVVISIPSMFEKAFLPYLEQELIEGKSFEIKDPLDRCMKKIFLHLSKAFTDDYGIVPMHDFEISPVTKRPKVLVQTAGHVAGAVRFYQKCDLIQETEYQPANSESHVDLINRVKSSKVFPVCVHPKYGGWFALRGILLFKNVRISDSYLKQNNPPVIFKSTYDIANLLYLFNEHWRDWKYRDVGMPSTIERYSDLQKEYFGTEPSQRNKLIETIRKNPTSDQVSDHGRVPLAEKVSNI